MHCYTLDSCIQHYRRPPAPDPQVRSMYTKLVTGIYTMYLQTLPLTSSPDHTSVNGVQQLGHRLVQL